MSIHERRDIILLAAQPQQAPRYLHIPPSERYILTVWGDLARLGVQRVWQAPGGFCQCCALWVRVVQMEGLLLAAVSRRSSRPE